MIDFCLGFVFSFRVNSVVLLKKSRTLHIGKWNGIGGKLEDEESALASMIRECKEEADLNITEWRHFGWLIGGSIDVLDKSQWRVFLYAAALPDTSPVPEVISFPEKIPDHPYHVAIRDLGNFTLAPHTASMVHMAIDKLRFPYTPLLRIQETPL